MQSESIQAGIAASGLRRKGRTQLNLHDEDQGAQDRKLSHDLWPELNSFTKVSIDESIAG